MNLFLWPRAFIDLVIPVRQLSPSLHACSSGTMVASSWRRVRLLLKSLSPDYLFVRMNGYIRRILHFCSSKRLFNANTDFATTPFAIDTLCSQFPKDTTSFQNNNNKKQHHRKSSSHLDESTNQVKNSRDCKQTQ